MASVGIDVGKQALVVVLLKGGQSYPATFSNDETGIQTLGRWLKKHGGRKASVCLEATGRYGDEVAWRLHEGDWRVSVVNPARIKAYAQSQLSRNKTDESDAALIADFCLTQQPEVWTPPSPAQRELQALVRHLDKLETMRQQERNRLQAGIPSATVRDTLQNHIAFLEQQIHDLKQHIHDHIDHHPDLKSQHDLLTSIPGIGDLTAYKLLAEIPDLARFHSADQLVAYAGLNPKQHRSGSSIHRPSRLSKIGNPTLRAALYMPAVVAKTHHPTLRPFAQQLVQRGKSHMVALGAVMRKLLVLVFAILRSQKPFDPNFANLNP